jgi:hypothetical protein
VRRVEELSRAGKTYRRTRTICVIGAHRPRER